MVMEGFLDGCLGLNGNGSSAVDIQGFCGTDPAMVSGE